MNEAFLSFIQSFSLRQASYNERPQPAISYKKHNIKEPVFCVPLTVKIFALSPLVYVPPPVSSLAHSDEISRQDPPINHRITRSNAHSIRQLDACVHTPREM